MQDTFWLNQEEYPFSSRYLNVPAGRLHYIDEGQGKPIVFVHGTPVWSFVYRNLIKALAKSHRCIALDHLGFGLSDKPESFAYTPEAHSQNLMLLLQHLKLAEITLVVHDFGGPIGLGYAVNHPENIKRLIDLNTWMWSLAYEKPFKLASALFGSSLGKFLYRKLNFSAKYLLPKAFYNRQLLTPALHSQYTQAFPDASSRTGTWRLAQELIKSGNWFESLWQQKEKIQNKPILVIWEMKDALIPPHFLKKWQENFPKAKVVELECGHFVQEEKPEELLEAVREFLN